MPTPYLCRGTAAELTMLNRTRNGLRKDVLPGVSGSRAGNEDARCCNPPSNGQWREGGGIRDRADPDVLRLEGFYETLGHAVSFRTFNRGKHGRGCARAISMVLRTAKIDPLSDSHSTGCGAQLAAKRFSMH